MAHARSLAARRFQYLESLALETIAGLQRALVPGLARIVLLEAGTGVDDQERARPLRMCAIERQRHVAAEREPADDRRARADFIEQCGHVGDRQRLAVGDGIGRIIGPAVAAHVPKHEFVMLRQRAYLALPHRRRRGIAVGQQQRWAAAMNLVVDIDPVPIEFWHCRFLDIAVVTSSLARSVRGWEMRKT